ncbi:hypothetical protein ACH5RR_017401 [Cinchona calisaya]|uniref:Uncharacterized protein n=1 Tax=Cinchona calisaya TaxID=153742 RepID=A0ABD2ZIG5_9GENT
MDLMLLYFGEAFDLVGSKMLHGKKISATTCLARKDISIVMPYTRSGNGYKWDTSFKHAGSVVRALFVGQVGWIIQTDGTRCKIRYELQVAGFVVEISSVDKAGCWVLGFQKPPGRCVLATLAWVGLLENICGKVVDSYNGKEFHRLAVGLMPTPVTEWPRRASRVLGRIAGGPQLIKKSVEF